MARQRCFASNFLPPFSREVLGAGSTAETLRGIDHRNAPGCLLHGLRAHACCRSKQKIRAGGLVLARLPLPPLGGRPPSRLRPLFRCHPLSPRLAAPPTQLGGGLVLAGVVLIFLFGLA